MAVQERCPRRRLPRRNILLILPLVNFLAARRGWSMVPASFSTVPAFRPVRVARCTCSPSARAAISWKPSPTCWQLPIRRQFRTVTRTDETTYTEITIGEYGRDGWGPGGADLDWYCSSNTEAHHGVRPCTWKTAPSWSR